jgi:predicted nucleic acid-binding protein
VRALPVRFCVRWSCRGLTVEAVDWEFEAEVFQWRGPAPYFFVATPPHVDAFLHAHHGELTYGWGVIPALVRIGETEVTTSLIPRDGVYLVPLKVALRRPEGIDDGDDVRVRLQVGRRNVEGPSEGTGMSTFVIDARVAIELATGGAIIPPEHSLTAPTLLRSQTLALVYESVRRGELDEQAGRKILDDIRGLRIRFLGDRSLEDHAWRLATKLSWPDIHQAEYIALTQLQADALVTLDEEFATAASVFVKTASLADILRP